MSIFIVLVIVLKKGNRFLAKNIADMIRIR